MKTIASALALLLIIILSCKAQTDFDKYFHDKTMRIDYFHIGDTKTEIFTIDKIYKYESWAGSLKNLIDNFNNGMYYAKIYDMSGGQMIFSKGFDSYFGEYKQSAEAAKGIMRTFHETMNIPYPKRKIKFTLEERSRQNKLEVIYQMEIDPDSIGIIEENLLKKSLKTYKSLINGDPHEKVDIAVIGEGYTADEEKKYITDLENFIKIFFNQEPYKSNKENFNIYGIYPISEESGADEPPAGIFRNTALSATYNSLGSERYLLTEDNKSLRDIATIIPYDIVVICVNNKHYGGGGVYNLFSTYASDNQWVAYLILHEFGHSFAGLADEYYTSDVAYNDFYPSGIEPVEPNITALLDSSNVKWKDFLTKGIQIPTPWEKEGFDNMDYAWQKERREMNNKIADAKKKRVSINIIRTLEDDYDSKDRQHAELLDDYLSGSSFLSKVGAFEGAGYSSKGLYRPMLDCIMFTKGNKPYCKVCENAILKMIKFYSE